MPHKPSEGQLLGQANGGFSGALMPKASGMLSLTVTSPSSPAVQLGRSSLENGLTCRVRPHGMVHLKLSLTRGRQAACLHPLPPLRLLLLPIIPNADEFERFWSSGRRASSVRLHEHHFPGDPQLQVTIADELERQLILVITALHLQSFPARAFRRAEWPKAAVRICIKVGGNVVLKLEANLEAVFLDVSSPQRSAEARRQRRQRLSSWC